MNSTDKKWKILSGWKGKEPKEKLPLWFLNVLANRGLKTDKEIREYLDPKYEDLLSFDSFLNMAAAVSLIAEAKKNDEKVVIYGDYDVDGITGTALLFEIFEKLGLKNVETYIPHREEEGYGLNESALDEIAGGGARLVVTIDCGVTSKEHVQYAKKKGLKVLICDHHEIEEKRLPKDVPIIHPAMTASGVSPQSLCACGMAYFFALALGEKYPNLLPKGQEKWLLDLVALATICDIVPLVGQNRILSRYGLLVLSKTKRPGLTALMREAAVDPRSVGSYAVGFLLGPRLNAAGRLLHAQKGLELLTADDKERAGEIARELGSLNTERQKMCERILEEAKAEIESSGKKEHEIFLLSNKNWPRGVVGIIASKLSDAYSRPVIVFEHDGKEHHGSARSVEGFNITEALTECEDCLLKYGGHAKAAGLSVADEKFIVFSDKLLEIVRGKVKKEDLVPNISIDTKIEEEDLTEETLDTISSMEPFGYKNSSPLFCLYGAELENIKKVGKEGEHLKFSLKKSGIGGIIFGNSHELTEKEKYDIAFSLRYNFWNNRKTIEMRVADVKRHDTK